MNHSSIVLDNGCSGGSVMQIQLFVLFLCWYGLVTKSIFIGFQFSEIKSRVVCFMFYVTTTTLVVVGYFYFLVVSTALFASRVVTTNN